MKFAKWVFRIAGVYGLLVMTPMYWMEERIGIDYPPPISHPEYFYGFIGVTIAWQILFLVLASDPVRFRLMMLPALVEKFPYAITTILLYVQERVVPTVLVFGLIDLVLGVLFVIAFIKTKEAAMQT